ncbi:MAG: glycoside hydrolase family 18 protein [Acidobacteriota bacterium]
MKRWLGVGCLGACLWTWASASPAQTVAATKPRWVSGFYVGYMAAAYPPAAIDFSSLTHIMVFAILPQRDATLDTRLFIDPLGGPRLAQEVATRAHAAGRKAILTVGGSGSGGGFQGATSPANMNAFVRNLVELVTRWGFDGVDLDWEPLLTVDQPVMLALVQKLKAAKPDLIVTADVSYQNANFPLNAGDGRFYAQLAGLVDQMNMMTYGMSDSWDGWAVWHSSAVIGEGPDHPTSVQASARAYLAAGVPAAKLGMGIGFYGSCWSAPATAPPPKPLGAHVTASDNDISIAAIKNVYRADRYHYDASAQAPYLSFTVPTGSHKCTFISYEDETSVAEKGRYAVKAGLGGTIIWQLNEGYVIGEPDPDSLLHAVGRAFGVARSAAPATPSNRRESPEPSPASPKRIPR